MRLAAVASWCARPRSATGFSKQRWLKNWHLAAGSAEHAGIVAALAASDLVAAERLMAAHLGSWEAKLPIASGTDPLARLRQALAPLEQSARILPTRAAL